MASDVQKVHLVCLHRFSISGKAAPGSLYLFVIYTYIYYFFSPFGKFMEDIIIMKKKKKSKYYLKKKN